jgi:hypothetical protein
MILLDEHFPESQRQLLRSWHVRAQMIGAGIARKGIQDDEIIPLLQQLPRPTFFSLDYGFYRRTLCHRGYCIIVLAVGQYEAASFVRRALAHRSFDTWAKRSGKVVRVWHTDDPARQWRTEALVPRFKAGQFHHQNALAFVDCLANGTPPPITLDDGVRAMKMIDAAYRAARTGQRQTLS